MCPVTKKGIMNVDFNILSDSKTGNKKRTIFFTTLLQNKWNSDFARFTAHVLSCLATKLAFFRGWQKAQHCCSTRFATMLQNKLARFLLPALPYLYLPNVSTLDCLLHQNQYGDYTCVLLTYLHMLTSYGVHVTRTVTPKFTEFVFKRVWKMLRIILKFGLNRLLYRAGLTGKCQLAVFFTVETVNKEIHCKRIHHGCCSCKKVQYSLLLRRLIFNKSQAISLR